MRTLLKLGLLAAACLALFLALIPAPCPSPPSPAPALPRSAFVRGAPAARIRFSTHSGLITVPVRINGSEELRMYLDTGMSAPVVVLFHKELIAELGLKAGQRVQVGGAGGQASRPATLAAGAAVQVGGIEMAGQRLVILDESRETSDWPVDGIIGKSLFDRYLTEFDFEKSMLTFYDPAVSTIEAPAGAVPVPLDLGTGIPVIEGAVAIDGDRKIPIRLAVDIGNRSALHLNEDAEKGLLAPPRTIRSIAGRGIQGEIPASVGRVAALDIGSLKFLDIPTSFIAPGTNAGFSRDVVAGNAGSLIWRKFRILLDYPGKRMFLVPNSRFARPFPFNMAGLVFEQDRDDAYFVRHVMENSPASEVGILEGDKVRAVNGREAGKYSYDELLDIFSAVGRKVKIAVERDGQSFRREVRLRRLV